MNPWNRVFSADFVSHVNRCAAGVVNQRFTASDLPEFLVERAIPQHAPGGLISLEDAIRGEQLRCKLVDCSLRPPVVRC